jgi:glycosyltransferase involved in cell wall biosynthesis
LKRSISRFDLILTVSEFSKAAIIAFCARHGLVCPPIRVTFEGFALPPEPASRVAKKNQVLHLASVELHKRTSTLLKLWQQMAGANKDLPELHLIGKLSPADRELASTLPSCAISGRLPTEALQEAMSSARAVVIPSEIEGFGLPALEAYAAGTPVLYVRGTAVEEIVGLGTPGGFLLDDPQSFESALLEVLNLPAAAVQRHAAQLREKFSWARAAEATISAYAELLGGDG